LCMGRNNIAIFMNNNDLSMNNSLMCIGVDPGLSGAIGVITTDGITEKHMVYDIPTIPYKGKKIIHDDVLFSIMRDIVSTPNIVRLFAVIEEQHPFPKQGAVSGFTLGVTYGTILTCVKMLKIPFVEVKPRDWQKLFGITGTGKDKKKQTKQMSCAIANKRYPTLTFYSPRGKLYDGRADAILMAEYGKMLQLGKRKIQLPK